MSVLFTTYFIIYIMNCGCESMWVGECKLCARYCPQSFSATHPLTGLLVGLPPRLSGALWSALSPAFDTVSGPREALIDI